MYKIYANVERFWLLQFDYCNYDNKKLIIK